MSCDVLETWMGDMFVTICGCGCNEFSSIGGNVQRIGIAGMQ